jgi:ribulose-5-phosphate 4-epimerase/fuculose-1-phosphate aldolase
MTAPMTALRPTAKSGRKYSQEEWQLRVELAAVYRIFALWGWDELIYNHKSVRVPGKPEHFLLNPWGLRFEEIKASDLLTVDLQGKLVDGSSSQYGPNKAGVILHGGILAARSDVNCVIHNHSIAGAAVASQQGGLLPMSVHSLMNWDLIAYHDFEGLVLDAGEQVRMNAALGKDKKILILRNHGMVTCGATVAEAFMLSYWLERACQIQLAALSGSAKPLLLSKELQELVPQQNKPGKGIDWDLGRRELDAVMRKLDGIDPSYRE